MEPRQHTIGKLVLNLEFNSEAIASELQQSFPQTFEERLKSVLAEGFSQISVDGETIVIDRLEVNLGEVSPDEFTEGLRKQLIKALQEQVTAKIKQGDRREVIKIPTTEVWSEILVYFLKNGHFPWWAGQLTIGELETAVLKETELQGQRIRVKLLDVLHSSNARSRMIAQFSPSFNHRLIANIYPEIGKLIFKTTQIINDLLAKNKIFIKETETDLTALIWMVLIQNKEDKQIQRTFPSQLFFLICKENNLKPLTILRQVPEPLRSVLTGEKKLSEISKPFAVKIPVSQKMKKEGEIEALDKMETVISNSGLVIFWPFLKSLFENLKLLSGNDFNSGRHQERAMLMLQYLVTGFANAEEQELLLNKILVGWSSERPVRKSIRLSKFERRELDEFLPEIIKNWSALKNSSVEALRETFLQRKGILRLREGSFYLKVERKGVDILRDNLPWTISIIKLPWMNEILYVEW